MVFALALGLLAAGQETFDGPTSPAKWAPWIADLRKWRTQNIQSLNYTGKCYDNTGLAWTQTSYVQTQVHTFDRYLYDPSTKQYTVERYLDDVTKRYGGLDSVLLWHTYPNIGADNRNQYDLTISMPGRVRALHDVVARFHARGVKVILPYNPWDKGTKDEGKPDSLAITEIAVAADADGLNGDTMDAFPYDFYKYAVGLGKVLAMEPEWGGTLEEAEWQPFGWGYWPRGDIPPVDKFKWLDPRRLTHVCNRWNTNHTLDIQSAWFNGAGFVAWENVWGIWNGITPRAAEELRRVAKLLRFFGGKGMFQNTNWEPHSPTLQDKVYASKWGKKQDYLWTIINKADVKKEGAMLNVTDIANTYKFYDLFRGVEIPREQKGAMVVLSLHLDNNGFGGVFATPNPLDTATTALLQAMKALSVTPLTSFHTKWFPALQTMVLPTPTVNQNQPAGMVVLPAKSQWVFKACSNELEGLQLALGIGFQFPWESHPQRCHEWAVNITKLWMDKFPVSNLQWKQYVDATHYNPADNWNYLRHWVNGTYRTGWEKKPVTGISLKEAKSYCAWAGKRLPTAWEWQYAAQGNDNRVYPWGNAECADCVPPLYLGRQAPIQADSDAYPKGYSPFDVADLVGNVWQYTSEFQDEHTRAVILRGGSNYHPQGSNWYFPQARRNDQMAKYHLFDESYERAGTIGFRCVADAQKPPPSCETVGMCVTKEMPHPDQERIDLSKEGALDWVHYGDGVTPTVDRKQNANVISDVAITGGPALPFNTTYLVYQWNDGTPHKEKNATGGIYLKCQKGNSFSFSVPAKRPSVLRMYLGAYDACQGVVTMSLSSYDAPSEHLINSIEKDLFTVIYVVDFGTPAVGAQLRVRFTVLNGTDGNIALQALTLQ